MITMMKPAGCFGIIYETVVILLPVEEVIQYCSPTAPKVFHKTERLIAEKNWLMMKAIPARLPNNESIYDETGAHIEKLVEMEEKV
jgi:hypothetical protein